MARSVGEWIGKDDDAVPPPRVRLRIFLAHGGRCAECTVKIMPGMPWQADHIKAVINGGANRESNLQPLCDGCHKTKTKNDVAVKAYVARKLKAQHGIKGKSRRPMMGSKASGWKVSFGGKWSRR